MALTYRLPGVRVSGLGGGPAWRDAELLSLRVPAGRNYGRAEFALPQAVALEDLPATGSVIQISRGGVVMFRGRLLEAPASVGPGHDSVQAMAADVRWDLQRIRIGQYGIGPFDPTDGAFEEVGYEVWFNREGRPNRSASMSGGAYTFHHGTGAQWWTRREVLRWIATWYTGGLMTVDADGVSTAWDGRMEDGLLYMQDVAEAISDLARASGEAWGVTFRPGETRFAAIRPGAGASLTIDLAPAEGGRKAGTSRENSAVHVNVLRSIEQSADVVEVHSNRMLMEHTYSSDGTDPLLTGFTPSDPRYAYGWRVDVTKYLPHGLGASLTAGARPKRWMRENLTRMSSAGAYYAAGSAEAAAGLGDALRPELCVWLRPSGGGALYWIRSGFTILHEEGVVLFEPVMRLHSGTEYLIYGAAAWGGFELDLTVTTETERRQMSRSTPPAPGDYHLGASQPVVETVWRSDVTPRKRYASYVPTWSASLPPTRTLTASGAEEAYVDVTAALNATGEEYWAARRPPAVRVAARLLGLPATAALGRRIRMRNVKGLTGDEVVTHLEWDAAGGDQLVVQGTNNLAELLGR